MLRGLRKLGLRNWKMAQITISATITGTEPISPWVTRRRKRSKPLRRSAAIAGGTTAGGVVSRRHLVAHLFGC